MTIHSICAIRQPPDAKDHPSLVTWAVFKSITLSVMHVLSVCSNLVCSGRRAVHLLRSQYYCLNLGFSHIGLLRNIGKYYLVLSHSFSFSIHILISTEISFAAVATVPVPHYSVRESISPHPQCRYVWTRGFLHLFFGGVVGYVCVPMRATGRKVKTEALEEEG